MNYPYQTMQLKDIILLTSTNEITLAGKIQRKDLRFDTQLTINTTQLNIVINELQKLNPDTDVSALFEQKISFGESMMYYLNAECLVNAEIGLDRLILEKNLCLVRA